MKRNLLLVILIGIIVNSTAQIAPDKYYIQFTDKNNSPYSINNPQEFLTQRAIDRRNQQGISISENDIPVNVSYLQGVADIGVDLLNHTRWLNGVTVYTEDSALIEQIEALPYVSGVLKFHYSENFISDKFREIKTDAPNYNNNSRNSNSSTSLDYGLAFGQIDQLNGIPLHDHGFQGEGMVIAVLDAGFTGVLVHPVFEYLWENDRILGTKDFVYMGGSVYDGHEHGKMVLSCMGGNLPGEMVGTAPEAEYWLLRSEEGPHENIIEEYNWVSAAEFADSVGADVINSSLSYATFDLPEWDYTPEDMDGNTAIATIGADIAASKGILVCNSAGNSGSWIGSPGDADSVFTVGAVDLNDQRASFSSIGPTADGRIKPTAMSCGAGATIAVGNVGISTNGYGTSFSSPIMAGMSACLWQSHPEMSVMEVQEAIKQSGSYANNPDNFMGWGIPNFAGADSILTVISPPSHDDKLINAGPSPFHNHLSVRVNIDSAESISVELINLAGNVVIRKNYSLTNHNNKFELTTEVIPLPQGIYFLKVVTMHKTDIIKVVKG
ncbi:MAG: S8 family serine peptidase [Bacteroidetes bacterium]|nr:S8 family serine peptidase [Bacteroidota bacterium]MBL6944295.1 S8 family serine peptidase [Bacteroidales bacterium]